MAERVGFEPTCPFGQDAFEAPPLRPLRYLSDGTSDRPALDRAGRLRQFSILPRTDRIGQCPRSAVVSQFESAPLGGSICERRAIGLHCRHDDRPSRCVLRGDDSRRTLLGLEAWGLAAAGSSLRLLAGVLVRHRRAVDLLSDVLLDHAASYDHEVVIAGGVGTFRGGRLCLAERLGMLRLLHAGPVPSTSAAVSCFQTDPLPALPRDWD
jgi:hypothetical protein